MWAFLTQRHDDLDPARGIIWGVILSAVLAASIATTLWVIL